MKRALYLLALTLAAFAQAAELTPAEIKSAILFEWSQDSTARAVRLGIRAERLTPDGLECAGFKLEAVPTRKRALDGSRIVIWTPASAPHEKRVLIIGIDRFAHALPHACGILTLYPVLDAAEHAQAERLHYALTPEAAAAARWKLTREAKEARP
jgi:hypothetical protein